METAFSLRLPVNIAVLVGNCLSCSMLPAILIYLTDENKNELHDDSLDIM
jgi:hypothetical protein